MKGNVAVFFLKLTITGMFIQNVVYSQDESEDSKHLKDALKTIGQGTDHIYILDIKKKDGFFENEAEAVYVDKKRDICKIKWTSHGWGTGRIQVKSHNCQPKDSENGDEKNNKHESELKEFAKEVLSELLKKYDDDLDNMKDQLKEEVEKSKQIKEDIEDLRKVIEGDRTKGGVKGGKNRESKHHKIKKDDYSFDRADGDTNKDSKEEKDIDTNQDSKEENSDENQHHKTKEHNVKNSDANEADDENVKHNGKERHKNKKHNVKNSDETGADV